MMNSHGRRPGFILVAALWLLVALSAVALDAALRSKARRLPAANLLDETRARQAALAGGEYARSRLTAALRARELELRLEQQRQAMQQGGAATRRTTPIRLMTGEADNPWREPAQLMAPAVTIGELQFELDVRDTGTALHINLASEVMIRQFLTDGIGLDYPRADHIAQAILDWRDEDDAPRLNGAERDDYIKEGRAVLPPNRPFNDIDELRHVMGMTPELLAMLRPFVTLVGSGRINVNSAPEQVLAALPGFRRGMATRLFRAREAGQYAANIRELQELAGGPRFDEPAEQQEFTRRVTYSTNEVAIVSQGQLDQSPVRARVVLVVSQSGTGAVVTYRRVE